MPLISEVGKQRQVEASLVHSKFQGYIYYETPLRCGVVERIE